MCIGLLRQGTRAQICAAFFLAAFAGGEARAQTLSPDEHAARAYVRDRLREDLATVKSLRPAYTFWQHLFTIPDGRIIVGSARDGRLLATFPAQGDWTRDGVWHDPSLKALVAGALAADPAQRSPRRGRAAARAHHRAAGAQSRRVATSCCRTFRATAVSWASGPPSTNGSACPPKLACRRPSSSPAWTAARGRAPRLSASASSSSATGTT